MANQENREHKKVNLNELEKSGCLRQKQDNLFCLRIKTPNEMFTSEQALKLSELARQFGQGTLGITANQVIELPWIHQDNIDLLKEELNKIGLMLSNHGSSIRATIFCPGTKRCPQGWVDSVNLAKEVDEKFYGKEEFKDLANKFEISISGCMNSCSKPQGSDVGFYGQVEPEFAKENCAICGSCERICPTEAIKLHPRKKTVSLDESKCIFCGLCILNCLNGAWKAKRAGLAMYVGGKWEKFPQLGKKIANFFDEKQAIYAIRKTLEFYIKEAKKGERLANLLNRVGIDKLRKELI